MTREYRFAELPRHAPLNRSLQAQTMKPVKIRVRPIDGPRQKPQTVAITVTTLANDKSPDQLWVIRGYFHGDLTKKSKITGNAVGVFSRRNGATSSLLTVTVTD